MLKLPEPQRSEKIRSIRKYGSPNVFSQFQPHVTLAWDQHEDLAPAFHSMPVTSQTFVPTTVALGTVGPHGTVMRGEDMAVFHLPHSSAPPPPASPRDREKRGGEETVEVSKPKCIGQGCDPIYGRPCPNGYQCMGGSKCCPQ